MITEGILNINKPQNMTSHDVVSVCRRVLGIRKIGHTGTLDPMATGVLPICIGRSTRMIEYLDMDMKKYRCTMELGLETDTQDIWGRSFGQISRNLYGRRCQEGVFCFSRCYRPETAHVFGAESRRKKALRVCQRGKNRRCEDAEDLY